MQLSQVRCDECNWSMRYLLCQDVILHQRVGMNDDFRLLQIPDYRNKKNPRNVLVSIVTLKDTDHNVDSRQNDGLWIRMPDNYTETRQRQVFNDYELLLDEYIRSLTVDDNLQRT